MTTAVSPVRGPSGMICVSPTWDRILLRVRRLAPLDIPTLITGETGTGKYLIAKELHESGQRGSFVHVDCPTIPEALFESEVFGSEPGAFTGATRKQGLIDRADLGTIVFDEIACLSFDAQAKLLRLLDDGRFRRLGGIRDNAVNTRIIAMTNADLEGLAKAGKFHADLFYRLDEAKINIPPLRERKEDIIPLIKHFVRMSRLNPHGQIILAEDPESTRALLEYSWFGNARKVRNIVNAALLEVAADAITLSTKEIVVALSGALADNPRLCFQPEDPLQLPAERLGLLHQQERSAVQEALRRCGGNQTRAAEFLGIPRDTFRYKMRKWKISKNTGKDE
jgi:DNA-binding NtrC family response regulator